MSFTTSFLSAMLLGALSVLVAPAAAAGRSVDQLELTYSVASRGRDLGRIEVALDQAGSPGHIEAVTRPKGLATLFAEETVERFTYAVVDNGWRAMEYSESDDGISISFRYGDRLLASGAGDDTDHPADSLVEPQGFPLSAFLLSDEELPRREILIPSKRGLRSYRYERQGDERLAVGDTRYDTVKWLRQRTDRDDRGFYIWSDKATRVPVRIEKFSDDGTMVIELLPGTLDNGS